MSITPALIRHYSSRFRRSRRTNALTAIHPGEHLAEELTELGMSAAELARKLDVPPNRITGILRGRRAITADTALRLAHFFGASPEFWLKLQNIYELRLAQNAAGKAIKTLPKYSASRSGAKARRQRLG